MRIRLKSQASKFEGNPSRADRGASEEKQDNPEARLARAIGNAMLTNDPNRRIDLTEHSRAHNAHLLRGHLLEDRARDGVLTIGHDEAENLERQALDAIDEMTDMDQGREPQPR